MSAPRFRSAKRAPIFDSTEPQINQIIAAAADQASDRSIIRPQTVDGKRKAAPKWPKIPISEARIPAEYH